MSKVVDIFTRQEITPKPKKKRGRKSQMDEFMHSWVDAIGQIKAKGVVIVTFDQEGNDIFGYLLPDDLQAKAALALEDIRQEIKEMAQGYVDLEE